LYIAVNAAVDDKKCVEMQEMSLALLVPCAVEDPLVLLLEVGRKGWTISTSVGFGGYGDPVIVRLVLGKL
jgi:hypothetical protein